jgi:hypothetical protein
VTTNEPEPDLYCRRPDPDLKKTVKWIGIGSMPIRIRIRLSLLMPIKIWNRVRIWILSKFFTHLKNLFKKFTFIHSNPDQQALDADPDLDPAK